MFSTALQAIVNADKVDQGGTIFNQVTQIVAYVIDVVLLVYLSLAFKKPSPKLDEESSK